MTGYEITLGYQSGYSRGERTDAELEAALREVVAEIRADPGRIGAEACRLGCPPTEGCYTLADYTERYLDDGEDGPDYVADAAWMGTNDDGLYVAQTASGSGNARIVKEHLRRAFCRLVIEAMHRRGIEVNLRVS